jgi:predicted dehydrogenase
VTEPVNVALVGYGYWGSNLARNIHASTTTRLRAIIDTDAEVRARAERAHPSAAISAQVEDALSDLDVEAVVIATPAHTHAELACAAMERGRHVLVEKPLAMDPKSADEVVALAERCGRVAMVGHTFLYSPPVQRMRRYVSDGDLGAVQYVYSQRLSLGRIRADCDALWNFAPHDVSIILYLLDERPTEASATGFSYVQDGIDDVSFASLRFPSGIGANVHVSWLDPRKVRLVTVVGDRKMVVFNDVSADQKLSLFDSGVARSERPSFGDFQSLGEFQWRTRSGDLLIPEVAMTEPLLLEMEAFGRACRDGEPPLASARHGADVVRVLHAISESARYRGAPVEIEWR